MKDIAEIYARGLADLGHSVRVDEDALPDESCDFPIVVAPQEYRPLFLLPHLEREGMPSENDREADCEPSASRKSEPKSTRQTLIKQSASLDEIGGDEPGIWNRSFLLCVDQPGSTFFSLVQRIAPHARGILDISPYALAHWKKVQSNAIHFPFPYRMFSDDIGPSFAERNTDVLFLGTDSAKRLEFVSNHCEFFDSVASRIHILRHMKTILPGDKGVLMGGERAMALKDARILLNLHASKRPYFEWHRAMLAISHGCVYVTESSMEEAPLEPGVHFLSGEPEELTRYCSELLDDPERGDAIRRQAHELLDRHFNHLEQWENLPDRLLAMEEEAKKNSARATARAATVSDGSQSGEAAIRSGGRQAARSLNLVRREGLRRDGKWVVAESPPCTLGIKPFAEWPQGLSKVVVEFRKGDVPPISAATLEIRRLGRLGKKTRSRKLSLIGRRIEFALFCDGSQDRCSLHLELPQGSRFRMPEIRLENPSEEEQTQLRLELACDSLEEVKNEVSVLQQHLHPGALTYAFTRSMSGLMESTFLRHKMMLNQAFEHHSAIAGKETHRIDRNFDPDTTPAPAVSIVIPLYNYATYVVDAMRSVLECEPADFRDQLEIVVADDASTDGGDRTVQAFMESTRIPVTLVSRFYNRGLAESRNLGAKHARGEFIFYLDADNSLLPNGLHKLWRAASSQNAPGAYGLLAIFYENVDHLNPRPANTLLSTYAWDPKWILQGNYIDAMALFRKSTLEEVGGYDSSLAMQGAPGWEDYEMWLRYMDNDLEPVFVPTVIGRYRKHGGSMMDTYTGQDEMVRPLLRKRYPSLFARYLGRDRQRKPG